METATTWFARFSRSINSISGWLEWVGLLGLMAMVVTALIDVLGSKLFHWPLPGTTEITSVIQVLAIAGGLAASKIAGRQIRVDIGLSLLPRRGKAGLEAFNALLGLGLFVVFIWTTYLYGTSIFHSGTSTFLLLIPLYPFALWIAICCIPMSFVIIIELVNSISKALK